jgi:HEAT repeat protein
MFELPEEKRQLAEIAVRTIGTNGIPTLLKMLGKKDSATKSRLLDFWGWHVQTNRYLPAWVRYPGWWRNQAVIQQSEAEGGFRLLGADARQAVPALISLYEQNVSPFSQGATSRALNALGPAAQTMAIPSYLRAAASSNGEIREVAVLALHGVNAEHVEVVPALTQALSDTNALVRLVAADGVRKFGTNAQQAVPALVLLLSDRDARVCGAASYALKSIDPEAAEKAGVK